jgi:hypothetical protein
MQEHCDSFEGPEGVGSFHCYVLICRFIKGFEALLDAIKDMLSLTRKDRKYIIEHTLSDYR